MADGGLLVIFAHPDDESLAGGVMARYADAGVPVTMLCATRGEAGEIAPGTGATPETLGAHREQELRDACAILGVGDVRFLDYRDSGMAGTPENDDARSLNRADASDVIGAIAGVIEEVRPRAIVTWDETGGYGHPDHVAVHRHASAAYAQVAERAGRPPALHYVLIPVQEFRKVMEEMQRRGLEVGEPPGDPDALSELTYAEPNCVIDVSAQVDRLLRALNAHRTQLGSFGAFTRMPDDLQHSVFGREYFFRAQPEVAPGTMLDDLFAGV
jgi:N-acetyl-1-D-myo-inositol-2-amino-2-deoxy-alpha-D-glucopyranoside deacetylase